MWKIRIKFDNMSALFVFLLVIMPSGTVSGINVKILLLSFLMSFIFFEKRTRLLISIFRLLFVPVVLILSLLTYSIVINPNSEFATSQSKDIFIFFITTCLLISIYDTRQRSIRFMNIVLCGLCVQCMIKLIMILISLSTGMPVVYLVKEYGRMFNMDLMTYGIKDSNMGRIQFLSDEISPIAIYYLTYVFSIKKWNKFYSLAAVLISISLFLGMSRFYWLVSIAMLLIAIMFNFKTKSTILSILFFSFFSIALFSSQTIDEAVNQRFDEKTTTASDSVRIEQLNNMTRKISESPLMGGGIGYYIPGYIRSSDMKYTYELQLPALVMQIGYIGFISIVVVMLSFFFKKKHRVNSFLQAILIFTIWLSSGFFNPVIFSSLGGMCYTSILIILNLIDKRKI